MFSRALEHSTIIYETPPSASVSKSPPPSNSSPTLSNSTPTDSPALLRLAWNKQDPNYLATFQMDSNSVLILDIRVPAIPVTELHGHSGPINSIGWAPHSSGHICTAGKVNVLCISMSGFDCVILIQDLQSEFIFNFL